MYTRLDNMEKEVMALHAKVGEKNTELAKRHTELKYVRNKLTEKEKELKEEKQRYFKKEIYPANQITSHGYFLRIHNTLKYRYQFRKWTSHKTT